MIAYLRRKVFEWTDEQFNRPGVLQALYENVNFRNGSVYVNGVDMLEEVNAIYFRAVGKEFEIVNEIARKAMHAGIPIVDSYIRNGATTRTKSLMESVFAEHGIPYPESVMCDGINGIRETATSFPCVAKVAVGGRGGNGTFMLSSPESIDAIRPALEQAEDKYQYGLGDTRWIVQQYVANEGDYRAMVIGDRCIGITKRRPKLDLFMMNTSSGKSRKYKNDRWPRDIGDMAVRAAQAMGVDVAGIDLVRGPYGPVVIEVNEAPAFKIFQKRTGIDVAGAIIDYMEALT